MEFINLKAQYQALKNEIDQNIQRVLDHGQYILGPEVEQMEKELEKFTGSDHCVSVASGTEALLIALMALDIKPGDEVITTPFTWVSTAEMIALLGAKPVFVDIDPTTCNINANLIEDMITNKTKAIMPVSLYGQVSDMDEINAIADSYGIPVIEDAAQSFGAEYKGNKSTNLSTIGCTSFFPSKPLGCYGDGGAIFTNDKNLAQKFKEIRIHGQSSRCYHTSIGVGGRMDTLQCAIVLAKLNTFEKELEIRQALGERYNKLLSANSSTDFSLLNVKNDRTCVWAQYTIFAKDRQLLIEKLKNQNIPSAIHYPTPLHLQPAYKIYSNQQLPDSERMSKQVLSLPMSAYLSLEEQDAVISAIIK
jgi:UDP-2-acetamido-2-deoxy-ribo-hexuluronate aminotransferase